MVGDNQHTLVRRMGVHSLCVQRDPLYSHMAYAAYTQTHSGRRQCRGFSMVARGGALTSCVGISLSFARKLRGEGSQLSQPCALAQLPHLILRVSVVGRGPSAYRTSSKVACYDILFSSCGLAKLATRPAVPAGTPTSQVRVAGSSLRAIAVGAAGEPSRPSQPLRASFRELSP